jgi:uncharacterized protein
VTHLDAEINARHPMTEPLDANPKQLEKLLTLKMPFGKYEGRVLADLPGNYLNWFAREGFPKGELGRLLALMQTIDHNGLRHLLNPLRRGRPQSP